MMKNFKNRLIRSISLTVLFFAFLLNAQAQNFELGLRFMPTFSSFGLKNSTGGTITGDGVIGFGVGGLFGYNFAEHFGLQGEIIYSTLGQKYTETDVVRNVNLSYINIPLLFSYNTGKTNPVNVNFVLGPQIGISAGSNLKVDNTGPTVKEAKLSVMAGDLGLALGAGVDFGLNSAQTLRLGVGFRGVFGLIDISDNSQTIVTNSYYILDKTKLTTYSGYIGLSWLF